MRSITSAILGLDVAVYLINAKPSSLQTSHSFFQPFLSIHPFFIPLFIYLFSVDTVVYSIFGWRCDAVAGGLGNAQLQISRVCSIEIVAKRILCSNTTSEIELLQVNGAAVLL